MPWWDILFSPQTGNKTLIGSMVRLPDNYLHLGECERVLRNEKYFKELIDLYHTKDKHKKGKEGGING